jgi:cell division protein FtsB
MKPLTRASLLALGLLLLALPAESAHRYRRPSALTVLKQKTQELSAEIDLLKMRIERLEQLAAERRKQAAEAAARAQVGPEEITYP